jgi:hypothetical protein
MHTHPSTVVDVHAKEPEHPPQLASVETSRVVRRVGLVDRIALRIGLALITWSRRPRQPKPSHELARQRAELERYNDRLRFLNAPPR